MRENKVIIRNLTYQDIIGIIELQEESFPSMYEEGSVWKEYHLKSHIDIFPEGQFCAVYKDKIIGSSSSLIVKLNSEYEPHTFSQATGNSLFTNHSPTGGDSLYGADVSVHPSFRRLGVASKLYKKRKELAISLNLRRIIAGGRLLNYCKYANKLTPEDYVNQILNKKLTDPVLSFQLRNGFKFIKILPNYLKDSRSLNNATFIEWINPYFKK
ncbi:GNAT family N-acetyltransferase [Candidatus Nitrosocosmicus hydrocola]|uniref:GNAT family N-acetyltransferase n=1 Tax=Candidatus Nitrosocosmicus hydrocola TaxID=1826872 RepID=UPI000A72604D|nr:GNAT family N-acetyltransferase [Candidatus Nitrosocosmicus hydrocola]